MFGPRDRFVCGRPRLQHPQFANALFSFTSPARNLKSCRSHYFLARRTRIALGNWKATRVILIPFVVNPLTGATARIRLRMANRISEACAGRPPRCPHFSCNVVPQMEKSRVKRQTMKTFPNSYLPTARVERRAPAATIFFCLPTESAEQTKRKRSGRWESDCRVDTQ